MTKKPDFTNFVLYVYDHCPYCVKARMIFGLKTQSFKMVTLLNDDEKTPKQMIGKKMVPILEYKKGKFMAESLDIIKYIDQLNPPKNITSWKQNSQLSKWLDMAHNLCYSLAMPRWVKAPLKEFKTKSAKSYFQKKKEDYIGSFALAFKQTNSLKKDMEDHLQKLEVLFSKKQSFFNGVLSVNDFHLFACLRSLTIVKNLKVPPKVQFYMQTLAKKSNIPLHQKISL